MKLQAHRLISMSPRETQSSHHFDASAHKLAEEGTWATVGSLQIVSSDESVEETSNQHAQSVAADGNLGKQLYGIWQSCTDHHRRPLSGQLCKNWLCDKDLPGEREHDVD